MGGIHCVTPSTAIAPNQCVKRLKKKPSATMVQQVGYRPMQFFTKQRDSGLKSLKVIDLGEANPVSNEIQPSSSDFSWLYGKWANIPGIPGWNGFMEEVTKDLNFAKSKILCLPFTNVLLYASEKCKEVNQQTCIVTFVQPLYIKARDIVACSTDDPSLSRVVVRLGGFHLLMSFMGSIGYIMDGSGLTEVWSTIYSQNSIDKMMKGHAYSRALWAHILTSLALATIILESIGFSDKDRETMEDLLSNDRLLVLRAHEDECFNTVVEKFQSELTKLEERGPTAKLWIQYFQMIILLRQFIEAERMGDWKLHLETVQKMLPYFHASGHFFYVKSCYLYLQDMIDLKDKMTGEEYEQFISGYFTIRRSGKFWSGLWTDMTVEQTLMRTMKSSGGLTRGRGISDSVLAVWTMGSAFLHNICDAVETFCNVSFAATEQHVDMRSSRITRDSEDLQKLTNWFSQHPPFPKMEVIMSIGSGITGDQRINCHLSEKVGIMGFSKMANCDFESLKFKRKDRVLPLSTVNASIRLDNVITPIDPLMLFQRMSVTKQSDEELQQYLQYELAPFPLSLFSETGMRKGTKSSFYKLFTPISDDYQLGGTKVYIIDGGHLLHKVVWLRGETFDSICASYIKYIERHYKSHAVVVFHGYPKDSSSTTKTTETSTNTKACCT